MARTREKPSTAPPTTRRDVYVRLMAAADGVREVQVRNMRGVFALSDTEREKLAHVRAGLNALLHEMDVRDEWEE